MPISRTRRRSTVVNEDKKAVAEILTEEAVEKAGYDSLDAAKEEGTAFVFMGQWNKPYSKDFIQPDAEPDDSFGL